MLLLLFKLSERLSGTTNRKSKYKLNLVTFARIIFCVHIQLGFYKNKNSVGSDLNQVEEKVARDSINSILVTEGGNLI